ncbi:unnamed protein product [Prorocentrum cordatum]|uniref:Mei2-like C-terminal RNA recognition motif domain-containing protein n=1 Tax=Prorocentrum cordatum TaxID=2364126 RepID=A0ABN9W6H2_9DINO|nr:unnamed protein product [Polarella glacialis]
MIKEVAGTSDPESITTVMVRNLPARCTQGEVVGELDRSGFEGCYDFCYMPCDFDSGQNNGYVFVNFKTPAVTRSFKETWHGRSRFPNHPDSRSLQVTAAHIQGYEANIAMLQTAGVIRNPNFRRLVISKSDPDRCSLGLGQPPPAAPPAAGLPAAPPPSGGLAEGAGPQTALPKPPGRFFAAPAGARPQTSRSQHHAWQHHAHPAMFWPGSSCQLQARQQGAQAFPGPAIWQWRNPAM